MHVHSDAFARIVNITLGSREQGFRDGASVTPDDAEALVGIAYLALDADDREDPDELRVVDEISQQLAALANTTLVAPGERATDDYERLDQIRQLGGQLSSQPVRELGYSLAYAVMVSDMELAPAETELLADVAVAFGISDARASELAAMTAEAVTPLG
jgi:hypothetical protein